MIVAGIRGKGKRGRFFLEEKEGFATLLLGIRFGDVRH